MQAEKASYILKSNESAIPNLKLRIMEALSTKLRLLPVGIALIIICVVFALLHPAFLSARNLTNLSVQIVNTAIVAMGLFFVLILGEIDLSVSALGAVCATISAICSVTYGMALIPSLLIGVAAGVVAGFIQGWVVTTFAAPAFIVTLGGQLAFKGLLLLILPKEKLISLVGQDISLLTTTYVPEVFSYAFVIIGALLVFLLTYSTYRNSIKYNIKTSFSRKALMPTIAVALVGIAVVFFLSLYKGINIALLMLIVIMAVSFYICSQTQFGVHLFAIGGNPEAVRRAGINVNKVKLLAFMLSSAIVAFGGIIAASRVQGVSAASGDPDAMMNAIAAAVLGGASLMGGRGSVWGILLGSLVIGSINNGMFLVGADTSIRLLIQGVILVLAIILDSVIVKASNTRG